MESFVRNQYLSYFCEDHAILRKDIYDEVFESTSESLDTVTIYTLESHLLKSYGLSLLSSTFHNNFSLRQWCYEVCPNEITIHDITKLFKLDSSYFREGEKEMILHVFKHLQRKDEKVMSQDFNTILEVGFTPFVIISASYNNEQYVKTYINSILSQRYILFRVIYGDDASTDQTITAFHKLTNNENKLAKRWTMYSQGSRMFQAFTKYNCYQNTFNDEILVFLDGDDHFNNPSVLELVFQVYQETSTEITFGSYCIHYNNEIVYLPNTVQPYTTPVYTLCKTLPRKTREWKHSHLRTGKAYLFKTIPKTYIQDSKGDWLSFSTDVAEMYWALDQCPQHIMIHNVLVNYNKTNSIKYLNSYYNNGQKNERREVMEYIQNALPAQLLMKERIEMLKQQKMEKSSETFTKKQKKINQLSFSKIVPNAYIINLERRPDRAKMMKSLCNKNGVSADIFSAIDGYSSSMQLAYERYIGFWSDSKKKYISKGALGLLCTYIKLLHQCLKLRKDFVCIFEDDARFHKKFKSRINNLSNLMKRFDVVYLGANQQQWDGINVSEFDDIYEVSGNRRYWTYGMFGVILNRRAMKKIYIYLTERPFWQHEYPIDCIMNQLIKSQKFSACVMFPNIVIADLRDSDMQKSRDMDVWGKKLRWELENYDVP